MEHSTLYPGSTIGILGSGQLGRMLAMAARRLGYRVVCFSPDSESPAGPVVDQAIVGDYSDARALESFARQVDVITFEFENVPASSLDQLAHAVPVRPSIQALHLSQNRLREKGWFKTNGFPVPAFLEVNSKASLLTAIKAIGKPGVLKTAEMGYDGKGQVKISETTNLDEVWDSIDNPSQSFIYETFVPFEKEISVIGARNLDGEIRLFPIFENAHHRHILDITFAPADIPESLAGEAKECLREFMVALDYCGLMTIEMFVTRENGILINEIAPRTHNSGHLTIDACVTSQFEQQVRAICNLPLGDPSMHQPAAMVNLLGDLWTSHSPKWSEGLKDPGVKLHLYGKDQPKPGRKMGHLIVMDESPQTAKRRACQARAAFLQ